jgi:hypothetical protein
MRARKHPWEHQPISGQRNEDGKFDETQCKVKASMYFEIFGNGFDALANTVSDNEQEKPTAPKISCQGVIKLDFVWVVTCLSNQIQKRVTGSSKPSRYLPLEV